MSWNNDKHFVYVKSSFIEIKNYTYMHDYITQ